MADSQEMQVAAQQLGTPIDVRPVFAVQRRDLLEFLRGLEDEEWRRPTACDGWNVADLLAHVLGDLLGRVSGLRDRINRTTPRSGESLAEQIDRTNDEWVVGCRQLSPRLMIELIDRAGTSHDRLWQTKGLDDPSLGVSWAGIEPAPVWLDAARDVTEYWVHERQLREAVGDHGTGHPDISTILDVFARGLPYTLSAIDPGVRRVHVESEGMTWRFARQRHRWWLVDETAPEATVVRLTGELLWRRWTRQPTTPPLDWAALSRAERAVLNHVGIVHSNPHVA